MKKEDCPYPYYALETISNGRFFLIREVRDEDHVYNICTTAYQDQETAIQACVELTGEKPKKIGSIWHII